MDFVATARALGENRLELQGLHADFDRLVKKTGIEAVYETDGDSLGLAERAASAALDGLDLATVELLVLVTQSPVDFLPANAISLAHRLSLGKHLLSFDLNQGCSGFVQALCVVSGLLEKYQRVLIVTADTYRKKLRPNDRATNAVFSDGAAAVVLDRAGPWKVIYEDHMTAGQYRDFLYQSVGTSENDGYLHMSGGDIWLFTLREVVPQIKKAIQFCEDNGIAIGSIYIHQASKVVVDGIIGKLEAYRDKFPVNYHSVANTVSSSIPMLMCDCPPDISKGAAIMVGFGVGLTSSVAILGEA